jgi:hypothetical protein
MKMLLDILPQANHSSLDIEHCPYGHQVACATLDAFTAVGWISCCSGKALEIITSLFTGSIPSGGRRPLRLKRSKGNNPWGDYNQLDLEHESSRMHRSMTSPGFYVDRTHNLYRMPSDLQKQSEPIVKHLKQHLFN